jgi:uncharacterized protein YecE (DUF72 family)
MPELACPAWVSGDVVYLRFHGYGAPYAGQYGNAGLRPWVERIRRWLDEDRDVYAYFNHDAWGHAIADAQTLQSLLDGRE